MLNWKKHSPPLPSLLCKWWTELQRKPNYLLKVKFTRFNSSICCTDGSKGERFPGAPSPASLAKRWAPSSVRELVSKNKVENDQGRRSLPGLLNLCFGCDPPWRFKQPFYWGHITDILHIGYLWFITTANLQLWSSSKVTLWLWVTTTGETELK